MPYQLYIHGTWQDAADNRIASVTNPATGEQVAEYAYGGVADATRAMDAAETAFPSWKQTPAFERAELLQKSAALIRNRAPEIARVLTQENGKPLKEALAETVGCASWLEWFAAEATHTYGRVVPTHTNTKRIFVIQQPVGVVVAITPWNFPVNLMARKIGAALAAGCTMVCRPASETPLSAMLIFECLAESGIPPGLVNLVTGDAATTVDAMMSHRACAKIAFTGSTAVGKQLMQRAGSRIQRVSLELGGHAPMIIFPDVDVAWAAEQAVAGKFRNAGQSCIAPSRFYVHRTIYEQFRTAVLEKVASVKVGDGLQEGVDMGPLINRKQFDRVTEFLKEAVVTGAQILTGGERLSGPSYDNGYFFAPTVLDSVTPSMRLTCEEYFGPLMPLYPFDTEEEVLKAANNTEYGLAGYVMTRDASRALRVAEGLNCGILGLNDSVPTIPHAPFGGWKESGIGREGGSEGINAYLEPKFISMGVDPH